MLSISPDFDGDHTVLFKYKLLKFEVSEVLLLKKRSNVFLLTF